MKLQFFPLLLVACAQAAPRSSDARAAISHRQGSNITGEVYFCTGFDFSGDCRVMEVSWVYESCENMPPGFLYNVSSFTPRKGTVCYLNRAANCSDICFSPSGCNEIVQYPGYANLTTYGNWTDNIGSISCEQDFSNP